MASHVDELGMEMNGRKRCGIAWGIPMTPPGGNGYSLIKIADKMKDAPLLILTYSFHIKAMEVNPPTTSNGPQESCEVLASRGFSDC